MASIASGAPDASTPANSATRVSKRVGGNDLVQIPDVEQFLRIQAFHQPEKSVSPRPASDVSQNARCRLHSREFPGEPEAPSAPSTRRRCESRKPAPNPPPRRKHCLAEPRWKAPGNSPEHPPPLQIGRGARADRTQMKPGAECFSRARQDQHADFAPLLDDLQMRLKLVQIRRLDPVVRFGPVEADGRDRPSTSNFISETAANMLPDTSTRCRCCK